MQTEKAFAGPMAVGGPGTPALFSASLQRDSDCVKTRILSQIRRACFGVSNQMGPTENWAPILRDSELEHCAEEPRV